MLTMLPADDRSRVMMGRVAPSAAHAHAAISRSTMAFIDQARTLGRAGWGLYESPTL
jgi:hypothetical protein